MLLFQDSPSTAEGLQHTVKDSEQLRMILNDSTAGQLQHIVKDCSTL